MLPRDVHYILNVQCEAQSEYAYLIARKESIYVEMQKPYQHRVLICDRDDFAVMEVIDGKLIYPDEQTLAGFRQGQGGEMTMEKEENPVVRRLLKKDQVHLDRIQVQMATAREFLIMVRLWEEKESEVFPYLSRIEKSLKEQGFSVKRADREDIKRILAVYYEQNVTTERFENFDGERWIVPED